MSEMSEQERAAEERLRNAERAEYRLKDEVREKRNAARAVIDEQLRAEYDEPLRLAAQKRYEAEKALDAERTAAWANKGPAVGTRYVEFESRSSWAQNSALTGRVAVVEQRTNETRLPENRKWGLPRVGEKFLRILKKDGTPGLNTARIGDHNWKPESDE